MKKEEVEETSREAEYLRTNKEHLWQSLEYLTTLAKLAKEKQDVELIGVWSERLEEIAKEYRRIVCTLESQYGDKGFDDLLKFDAKYYVLRSFYSKHCTPIPSVSPPVQVMKPISHIRFPELNLPRFSGKLTDWCVFRDAFQSAIGNRDEISNIDKFQYLKGLVQGDAARIIASITISEDGYHDAWRALKLRYENKRQLIRCHIKALYEIPSMKKESADELLNLVDRFEHQMLTLKRLGESTDNWDSLLVYQLSTRLDPNTLKEWESYCARLDSDNVANVLGGYADEEQENEEIPTYTSMVNYLQNYARVLQSVGPLSSANRERDGKVKLTKSTAYLSATSSSPVQDSNKKCEKCQQCHFLYHCPDFQKLSEQQRFELVRAKKLCANCLRSTDHFAKSCPCKPCNRCPKKHHTLLHGAQFIQQPSSAGPPASGSIALVAQASASSPVQPRPQPTINMPATQLQSQFQPQWLPPAPAKQLQSQFQPQRLPPASATQLQNQTQSHRLSTANDSHPQQQSTVSSVPESLRYAMVACKDPAQSIVILPTALVEVIDARGHKHLARCLLDSGSQSHFITNALCDKLQLPRTRVPVPVVVCGIGRSTTKATQSVTIKVSSRVSPYVVEPQLLVLPSLSIKLPGSTLNIQEWHIHKTVRLADPTFHVSNEIDLILGAQFFFDTLRYGRIELGEQMPVLQNSTLGWIVSGPCTIRDHDHTDQRSCFVSSAVRMENILQKFWELETVRDTKGWSITDKFCEEHFLANTTRTTEGRYVVRLPKREDLVHQLDDNMYQATRRFHSLERSLMLDPQKKELYKDFVAQYIELGHMREVSEVDLNVKPQFILPHHGVLKLDSATTKLRTVFDASCRSRSGLALNDVLVPGPCIQQTLLEIVLRFRTYRFVVTADIEKMFRQVLVHPSDQPLQRILWRDAPESILKVYQLLTITYGLNNSPFLATRVLQQLATDEEHRFPTAAGIARRDFYVDNLLTGSNDKEHLKITVTDMIELLAAGGFPLRQWSSNCQEILDVVPEDLRETRTLLELDRDASVTALGLRWEPGSDQLSFKPPKWKENQPFTKRTVLSQMSSLFDPLGLLGPSIVQAKIIMQALWKCQLEWDTPLPEKFVEEWMLYQQDIFLIDNLRIPRSVMITSPHRLEIHGFSDASMQAYGACIYVRSIDENNQCSVQLLAAKSRVTPLSSKSIPRLELSAALLLSHLLEHVMKCTSLVAPIYLWTDSTITLDWISAPPSTWKTFVSNRVAEIQELTATAIWNHVPSEDNPADFLSRGTSLRNLIENVLWWHGPAWIRTVNEPWPAKYASRKQISDVSEFRQVVALPVLTTSDEIIDRYSSLTHLVRVAAWCRRFRENARRQEIDRITGSLSPSELNNALIGLVGRVQEEEFGPEMKQLVRGEPVSRKSKLKFLNPQLVDGVIRVGGRLHHSAFAVDARHPLVLPANHQLTRMIASLEHLKTLHGGPNLLLSSLRRRFWPLNGRNLASATVHGCVTCARASPKTIEQLMGNLPPVRVNRAFPFENVGVDFAGPMYLRAPNKRSAPVKTYVAVYVCLAVKAIHLDLVPDLSSEGFIASLRRFSGRRGKPNNIYCDNGRNFVGAQRELEELRKLFISQQHKDLVTKECATDNITFHFIPPRSPSLGGIWEAAVKSMKFHLRRIVGNAMLTETEYRTALIQVEAMLNSRPITAMSEDPQDLQPLTPGHFLVGKPLNAIPEPLLHDVPENRQSRWQRVQCLTQQFWKRWQNDYLSTLHNRYRWSDTTANLSRNSIVLLRDENLPPLKWAIGRVVDVHPGTDGLVRVVSVKTSQGVTKRAVGKLCLLPVELDPAAIESQSSKPEVVANQ
ncbi:uncharacterized protein LOC128740217 [Sabethes cyaneus]|uniref:uncharacterized protein LOC128740217 n=1 Tax=Sabethes cyaneus TaxID=53552 RepID=UPI00237DD5D9|nr:uncharacterized protein LOC128740217 [Sabethes cyaneus]